jgi:hypothetical protein
MFGDGNAFVSTRSTLIKTAAAGGAALFSRLGITPSLAVEATGKAGRPLKAAFSNAGPRRINRFIRAIANRKQTEIPVPMGRLLFSTTPGVSWRNARELRLGSARETEKIVRLCAGRSTKSKELKSPTVKE